MTNLVLQESFKDMDVLTHHLNISTMSITCMIIPSGNKLDLLSIESQFSLDDFFIMIKSDSVFMWDKREQILKKMIKKKSFHNQLTLVYKYSDKIFINLKVFTNGSVQVTGCKNILHFTESLQNLINKIYPYVLRELKISQEKINLINCTYHVKFNINRKKFYKLFSKMPICLPACLNHQATVLTKSEVTCRYSPEIHAALNIKYKHSDFKKHVTVFIFQTGNIIIAGGNSIQQIILTKNIIDHIMYCFFDKIVKKDVEKAINLKDINSRLEKEYGTMTVKDFLDLNDSYSE
ncbi:putative TATA-box binding protein [Namao virus]|nr:putative TATA-box binding protein [Namao virus]